MKPAQHTEVEVKPDYELCFCDFLNAGLAIFYKTIRQCPLHAEAFFSCYLSKYFPFHHTPHNPINLMCFLLCFVTWIFSLCKVCSSSLTHPWLFLTGMRHDHLCFPSVSSSALCITQFTHVYLFLPMCCMD